MTIRRRSTAIATSVALVAGGAATAAHATGNISSIFGQEQCVLSAVELPAVEGLTVSVEGGQVVDAGQAERIADAEAALAAAYEAWRTAASNEFDLLERLQAAWEKLRADEEYMRVEASLPELSANRMGPPEIQEALAAARDADPAYITYGELNEALSEIRSPGDEGPYGGANAPVPVAPGEQVTLALPGLADALELHEEADVSIPSTAAVTQLYGLGSDVTAIDAELVESGGAYNAVFTAPDVEGAYRVSLEIAVNYPAFGEPGDPHYQAPVQLTVTIDRGVVVHSGWASGDVYDWATNWLDTQERSPEYIEAKAAQDEYFNAFAEALDFVLERPVEYGYDEVVAQIKDLGYRAANVLEGSFVGFAGYGDDGPTHTPEYAAYRQALVTYLDALGADGATVLSEADAAARDVAMPDGRPIGINEGWGLQQTPHDVFTEYVTSAVDRAQLEAGSTGGDSLALLTCGSETAVVTLTAPGVEDAVEVTISADGVVTGPAEVSTVEGEIAALAWGSGITELPAMAQTITVSVPEPEPEVPETPEVPEEPKPEPPTPRTPERPSAPVPPVPSN